MAHRAHPPADARPRVVFVPGFMQRGEAWRPVAERLGERYPTVLLDHRTHDLEGRVGEVLEAIGPAPAVLAGYSLGGRVALHAALRDPSRVAALLLVGTTAGIEDAGLRKARLAADEDLAAWIEASPIEDVVERWEGQPVFAGQSPGLVAAQRPGRLSHDPRDLARLLRSAGQGACPPVWDRLSELGDTPVLAVAGERDETYMRAARRFEAALSGGKAHVVPDAGHAAHLERPGAVAAALEELVETLASR